MPIAVQPQFEQQGGISRLSFPRSKFDPVDPRYNGNGPTTPASGRLGARDGDPSLTPLQRIQDCDMPTTVQFCRIGKEHSRLLVRQAKRRNIEVGTLSSLYLTEKALEEEFPGIGFRDSAGGREAYVLGHRVAVWEVIDAHRQAKSVAKTAKHFRWPPALVRTALAYSAAYPAQIGDQRSAELAA